ncbi:hypothetical protein MPSEU_000834200 [Mayamaea pseudoterrestris]|nr:hypothetical protein MPSEU_000834200 [Mayamaea pseudoterrestris]
MAKGKQGLQLEAWKFGIYIGIPIIASWWFSDPVRQRQAVEYYQYVKYPANPNTNMKEQIERLQKQQEQHQAYREQLRELNKQANRTTATLQQSHEVKDDAAASEAKRGWLRWIGLGGKRL